MKMQAKYEITEIIQGSDDKIVIEQDADGDPMVQLYLTSDGGETIRTTFLPGDFDDLLTAMLAAQAKRDEILAAGQ